MKKNEDGEVELVLGNGQLLGVFFIVVILLALFFGMGYIMGRNSGPATTVDVATVHKSDVKPLVVDSPVPKEQPADGPSGKTDPSSAAPSEKLAESAKQEKTKTIETKPESAAKAVVPADEPPSGVFLQIAAIPKQEAELEIEVLRKKNFSAIVMEVPDKPGSFRVLVGPIAEGGVNKARDDLQNAGFPGKSAIFRRF
ncbi:MAG: SPOR domain-containing protein [Bryobacterales bacterium]|nr:SPOR domain-containing protein [Bryobacterales bacterium]MBV9397141.1 SPOR domain-containing protein [Bryobacterales bacterium]